MKAASQQTCDSGSIAPLAIGLALLSLTAVLMSVSAGSMFLLERRLTSLAEFAALSRAATRMSVVEFLREAKLEGYSGLTVTKDEVVDGFTSEVRICSQWNAPLPTFLRFEGRQVCGFGAARAG